MQRISHWVNNKVVAGTSGNVGKVYNPATGEVQAEVDLASVAEVDAVVAVAKEAFVTWRATNLSRRAEIMFRMRELVDANRKELANIVSLEHGKVPSDAMGEIARGLENIEFACGIPAMLKGGYSEQASGGVDVYSIRQPLGVVAGITPFNFPAMVPMWMFANAIMCGNTFVLKPSEKDPSAAMFVADLLRQAGLPEGVFNVVHGDKVSVDRLLEHKDVQSISFVQHQLRSMYTKPEPRTASAFKHLVAQRTTCSCFQTPTSTWQQTQQFLQRTVQQASVAWQFRLCLQLTPLPTHWLTS